MTTTLSVMTAKKQPEPSDEEVAARELARLAKEQGLSLSQPGGLLKETRRERRSQKRPVAGALGP